MTEGETVVKQHERDISLGEAMDLGVALAMQGNHRNACTMFRAILIHEPENFEAISRLGSSLFELGLHYEALYWFWRARKAERRHPLALSNYGMCVSQLGHWEEGLVELERAAWHAERAEHMTPAAKSMIFNNLGNTLERLRRHPEALKALDKGIAYDPNDPFPHYNRGIALLRLNRHREGIAALDRALALQGPITDSTGRMNEADAKYNRSMAHLLLGNFADGFRDYEYRLLTTENKVANLGLPADKKWNGESMAGKRILLHAEQGLGDTIQYFRFVPELVERGADVRMIVHNALRPIADAIPGVTTLEPGSDLTDAYDYWVAMLSLPFVLGVTDEAKIPAPWWPENDEHRVNRWRSTLQAHTFSKEMSIAVPWVGVCWAGNFQHKNDEHRSIALKTFAKLFDAPCNFVSLQQMRPGETEEFAELKKRHPNLSALYLEDFRDTAAVMRCLDLVITVDTAVAHVAGSVGAPTWTLLPKYSTDWRWMLNRSDSPWYPSMKLVRQETIGDWGTVISRLRQDLSAMAAQTRAA